MNDVFFNISGVNTKGDHLARREYLKRTHTERKCRSMTLTVRAGWFNAIFRRVQSVG